MDATSSGIGHALVQLMAGIINDHILSCDHVDGEECEGCCPICCAPCHALASLRDHEDEAVTGWMLAWDERDLAEARAKYPEEDFGFPEDGLYDWQRPDHGVNWAIIEKHWHGCPNHEDQ